MNGYDRGHGHSIYTQNKNTGDSNPKIIADNILFNAGDEGIQAYGSGNASVSNYLIQGNTIFNNGILAGYGANYGPVAYQILCAWRRDQAEHRYRTKHGLHLQRCGL